MIGVPIDCGGIPGGTEFAPDVLRRAGLGTALGSAIDAGDMNARMSGTERDPACGIIGFPGLIEVTREVRKKTGEMLKRGERPFLIGGCCSFMMGALAGAADHIGNVGLAYIDGHMDLYDGKTSPGGEAADMPLALMLGHGVPSELARAVGGVTRIDVPNTVLLGYRDRALAVAAGSMLPEDIGGDFYERDAAAIKNTGATRVGQEAQQRLESRTGGFWLHLDFDVLDEKVFPAVDYLMPGGLDFEELRALVKPLAASPKMIGMSMACYNPDLDPGHVYARKVVDFCREIVPF